MAKELLPNQKEFFVGDPKDWGYFFSRDELEKFAEAIVRECCQMTLDLEIKYPANLTVREIKRHFGVEQ